MVGEGVRETFVRASTVLLAGKRIKLYVYRNYTQKESRQFPHFFLTIVERNFLHFLCIRTRRFTSTVFPPGDLRTESFIRGGINEVLPSRGVDVT